VLYFRGLNIFLASSLNLLKSIVLHLLAFGSLKIFNLFVMHLNFDYCTIKMFEKLPDCLRRAYGSSLHHVTLRMTGSYEYEEVIGRGWMG